jgi:hypothetical protein
VPCHTSADRTFLRAVPSSPPRLPFPPTTESFLWKSEPSASSRRFQYSLEPGSNRTCQLSYFTPTPPPPFPPWHKMDTGSVSVPQQIY